MSIGIRSDRLLKNSEALASADSDGQDNCAADDGNPEIALLRHDTLSK
jgi:hypothetical protein